MKVLAFPTKQTSTSSTQTEAPLVTEIITINFRKQEVTKMVELENSSGRVLSSYEMIEKPTPFMGEGFGEIVNLLLKKHQQA